MKKLAILTISMLTVSGVFAQNSDFEQARNRVYSANARWNDHTSRIKQLDSQINGMETELSQISGKPEYAKDFEARQEKRRQLIEQRNALSSQCPECVSNLSKELHSVSGRYHVVGGSGSFDLTEPAYKKPAPIRETLPPTTGYGRSSTSYVRGGGY